MLFEGKKLTWSNVLVGSLAIALGFVLYRIVAKLLKQNNELDEVVGYLGAEERVPCSYYENTLLVSNNQPDCESNCKNSGGVWHLTEGSTENVGECVYGAMSGVPGISNTKFRANRSEFTFSPSRRMMLKK